MEQKIDWWHPKLKWYKKMTRQVLTDGFSFISCRYVVLISRDTPWIACGFEEQDKAISTHILFDTEHHVFFLLCCSFCSLVWSDYPIYVGFFDIGSDFVHSLWIDLPTQPVHLIHFFLLSPPISTYDSPHLFTQGLFVKSKQEIAKVGIAWAHALINTSLPTFENLSIQPWILFHILSLRYSNIFFPWMSNINKETLVPFHSCYRSNVHHI